MQIIYSTRKSLGIYITKQATIEVRAPFRMPKKEILAFVKSKETWIENKIAQQTEKLQSRKNFSVDFGHKLLFLGTYYPVIPIDEKLPRFQTNGSDSTQMEGFFVPSHLRGEQIKVAVIHIYKTLAQMVIPPRVEKFSKQMGVLPKGVKINSAKTRWGSCSGKNSINFSWLLMMAPSDTVDAVIVHELAHIKEHNHSASFWAVVKNTMPDYEKNHNALNALQNKLLCENWDISFETNI